MKVLFSFYRRLLSPALHLMFGPSGGCRFIPTCSEYSEQAFRERGFFKGLLLTLLRLLRCNPFASSGYDPVPRGIASPRCSSNER